MADTTYVTPHDGSGTSLSFAGSTYKCTSMTYSKTDVTASDRVDTSTLDIIAGNQTTSQARPLKGDTSGDTGWSLSFDYIGNTPIDDGKTGALVVSGGLTINSTATCTDSSVTATVNDVVRGSATLRVDRP